MKPFFNLKMTDILSDLPKRVFGFTGIVYPKLKPIKEPTTEPFFLSVDPKFLIKLKHLP